MFVRLVWPWWIILVGRRHDCLVMNVLLQDHSNFSLVNSLDAYLYLYAIVLHRFLWGVRGKGYTHNMPEW